MRFKLLIFISLAFLAVGIAETFSRKSGSGPGNNNYQSVLSTTSDGSNSGSGSSTSGSPTNTPTPTLFEETTVIYTPTPTITNSTSGDSSTTVYEDTTIFYTPTPTPTYYEPVSNYEDSSTSTTGTGGYDDEDRFASLNSATISCIESRLTSSELEFMRYSTPQTSEEEEELEKLKEKVLICFQTYQEAVSINEASGKLTTLSDEVKSCIIQAIGKEAFDEVSSGKREATKEEKIKGEACLQMDYETKVVYKTDEEELEPGSGSCLLLALGKERYSAIEAGGQPTLEERKKSERCFGAGIHPLQKKPIYQLSENIEKCLKENLSEEKYNQLKTGRFTPSYNEKISSNVCFASINKLQKNVLPPPPVQVPFLEEKPGDVSVRTADRLTKKINEGIRETRFQLKGKGPANSLVDIFIFSEPIVVVTQTDENGDWVYELDDPLEEGTHIVYATVKGTSGERVRSSIFNLEVLAADNQSTVLLPEDRTSNEPNRFLRFASIFVVFSALVVVAAGFYLYRTVKSTKGVLNTGDRKGERKTGPGSVN